MHVRSKLFTRIGAVVSAAVAVTVVTLLLVLQGASGQTPVDLTAWNGATYTAINSGPDGETVATRSVTFTYSSTYAGTYSCRLQRAGDAPVVEPCGSTPSASKTFSGLIDGDYVFEVTLAKTGGGAESAMASFSVDAPPITSITSGPTGTITTRTVAFAFTASEPSTFGCTLTPASGAPQTAACNGGTTSYSSLADGSYTFAVVATDSPSSQVGNASRSFTVDLTGPATSITTAPAASSTSASESIAFSSTAPDKASFQCSLDGAAFATCTSPRVVGDLAVGNHRFAVRGLDTAGNVGAEAVATWTRVAVTPPVVTPPADTTPTAVTATTTKPAATVTPSVTGVLPVALVACNEAVTSSCIVRTTVVTTKLMRINGKYRHGSFGSVSKWGVGGTTITPLMKLSRTERALVQRLGSVSVTATTVVRDASGNTSTVTTTFVLTARS